MFQMFKIIITGVYIISSRIWNLLILSAIHVLVLRMHSVLDFYQGAAFSISNLTLIILTH